MDTKVSKKLKIGVLGSTRGKFQFLCDDLGSDLQAIIDKIEANELQAEISIVISNKKVWTKHFVLISQRMPLF